MRWKHFVVGLALSVAGIVGCKQQCFLTYDDYDHYSKLALPQIECDPSKSIVPLTRDMAVPATINDPDRQIRFITLNEAIALALENGRIGPQAPDNAGGANSINGGQLNSFNGSDGLVQFGGRQLVNGDSIRAFALDPASTATSIDSALSKFDAQWNTSLSWNTTDEPPGSRNSFNNGNTANFLSEIVKPLPSGGVARIQFGSPQGSSFYENLQNPALAGIANLKNPSYNPALTLQFEQPLLQGFGVEINQLRSTHPGSTLNPFSTQLINAAEGILVTRIRFDEQRAEFQRLVNYMLLNVEIAYWNLYGQYWTLYSQEQALRQSFVAWKINKVRFEAGRIDIQNFAQTRQQYELFRGQRLAALANVLESERGLRSLLGLPPEDGNRLVPIDTPILTPYQPDWHSAVNETLANRPELILARQDLKASQLDVINSKNLLLPDLRIFSSYGLSGVGTSLAGTNDNAFRSLASDKFNDWEVGLRLNYVIGYRDANSNLRRAKLNLARSYVTLKEQEDKALSQLELRYRQILEFYQEVEIQRSNREYSAQELEARNKEFIAGRGTLDILLEAQRKWATALSQEYIFVALYNNALAGFEFAKGTILQSKNVVISEGPLPACAQERAVEHERQRSKALVLRERAMPPPVCAYDPDSSSLPALPTEDAARLPVSEVPAMLSGNRPAVKEPPFQLPQSTRVPSALNGGAVNPATLPSAPDKSAASLSSFRTTGVTNKSPATAAPETPRMLPLTSPDGAKALNSQPQTLPADSSSKQP